MILLKTAAFIRKDFLIESSYKMAFVLTAVGAIFPLITYFFIGEMMGGQAADSIKKYGGEYFPFVLIGLAFTSYFQLAITTFSDTMRRAQMAGCLEAILSAQTGARTIVLLSSFYSFISSGVQLLIAFLVGILLLNFSLGEADLLAALVIFLLSLLVFISLGIISAAGTIIFKKGEPFGWLFGTVSGLFGGAFFPVEVMPEWMQWCSLVVPITYSLDALRLTMLQGYSLVMVGNQALILLGMAVLLFPLSLMFFAWAVERGKRDGTLIQY